jgi:hypothetical protein
MSTETIEEHGAGLPRAIRHVQRVLLRNDLDPFEFVVAIREAPLDDHETTYVLEISTADGAVSIQKAGLPRECIEGGRETGGDDLASFVEGLVPELLASMKAASRSTSGTSPATQPQGRR